MSQNRTSQDRFAGPHMIQDSNHMSDITPVTDTAQGGRARQTEQAQSDTRQQGSGDRSTNRQQGDARRESD